MASRPMRYVLDHRDHTPIALDDDADLLLWGQWFEDPANRIVARTDVEPFRVSTVFLGLDHNFGDDGPPILFETMVFALHPDGAVIQRGHDFDCRRYQTWDEAVAGHALTVQLVEASLDTPVPAAPPPVRTSD